MSSPSITPRTRRRDDDDDTDHTDSEDSGSDQRNKRRRLNGSGDGSEDDDSPVLPDSFRRSPKGKGRARDALVTDTRHGQQDHHPGSIVRVTLIDFVTYTKAEFRPGPNLNMVIGPNGTGKSTLVCAICIGLGWSTAHLGRAKDIAEFVKHGRKSATIEIELKADPNRHSQNPVITHKINREGSSKAGTSKSVYLIDGKKSNNKAVQELARSFSIQVDNLCQFLPQDRVVEFAALSPVDLLKETQRAAAPQHMAEWHDQLKIMGKEQRKGLEEQQALIDDLKSKEDRQRSQEDLVNRLRERNVLQHQAQSLERLRPFAEYAALKNRHKAVKKERKEADKAVRRLERKMQPNTEKIQAKESYVNSVDVLTKTRQRLLARTEADAEEKQKKCEKTGREMEACVQELDADRKSGKAAKDNMRRLQNSIRDIQRALANPPEAFDAAALNEEIRAKSRLIRENENSTNTAQGEADTLKVQIRQRNTIIGELQRQKAELQSQAGRQKNKLASLSSDTATAWQWIQANSHRFTGTVYGPPIITCSVKDPSHANAVESALGRSELLSFTVTSKEDFELLSKELYKTQGLSNINIRATYRKLEEWQPPCDETELKRLGGECWLLDLIEGPDDVLAMLCDNRSIHATGFARRDLDSDQWDQLQESGISNFLSLKNAYQVIRRREYGAAGTSTRVSPVKNATMMTDAPVDTQQEQERNQRITVAKGEIGEIQKELSGVLERCRALDRQREQLAGEKAKIEEDKAAKQRQHAEFNGLATKLESLQSKLETVQASVRDQSARRLAIVEKQDKLCLEKGQQALDFARTVDQLRALHLQALEAEIMRIEAQSDLEQLEASNAQERHELDEMKRHAAELKATKDELVRNGNRMGPRLQEAEDSLEDDVRELYQKLVDEDWSPERLETEIQSVRANLDMLHGGNENVIREYEQRAKRIEELQEKRASLEQKLDGLSRTITELRDRWEPELDRVVGQISDAFSENFSRIHCAGEVAVHKDDDFEQWAIQIKVKFREKEQLSILDSHRQSGGERAVSTIFYLMALQSLARAPFRVVDEINQGMDPRNERLVHSRMVEIACAEHTSQYFLITPKLLNNLTYHENMKVHCIASGEYMPDDPEQLNFEKLAHKALALRAA